MNVSTFSSSSSEGSGRRMTLIGTRCTGAVSEREKMDEVAWAGVGVATGSPDVPPRGLADAGADAEAELDGCA